MVSSFAASGVPTLTTSTTSPTPYNIVHGTYPQLVAYLILNIWASHLGIPVLLTAIVCCRKIKRHPTFINLCIIFIIEGISSALLLYAGRIRGPEPNQILCLLQASLLYGYPPMASVGVFVLVLQMFLVLQASHHGLPYKEGSHVVRLWLMLIAPWITFFATLLTTAALGSHFPNKVSRNRRFFYCSLENNAWTNSLTVFSAIFLFLTIVYEGWLLYMIYKRWTVLQSKGQTLSAIDFSLPLRIVGFGMYLTLALSLSLLSIKAPHSPVPDLTIATASSVFVLIFGTQRDILDALLIWRAREPKKQTTFIPKLQDTSREVKGNQKIPGQLSWPRVHAV